ncbi:unnamed protein product [Rotaria socialis]|uniref:protein xylosyltransferase n=1 Tax=Rotaria socialis TaxID=392032 RepID=A0A821DLU5_9BILA|nr:unnamed protein product [Rotaria socialis]CAF3634780.1 unnamed protein product [Rotaria socialis]CAF4167193.1 unnamed protein product [Rotaria socialis]CAF4622586.1 unnamed protein product [Rotaria socialis]
MFRWIACPFHRPLHYRRSIIFPIITFMITTGLLYGLVEHYTYATHPVDPDFHSNYSSSHFNCQLRNETVRAIDLASSDYCKNLLQDTSCKINSITNFFPKSLPRLCPIQKGHFGDVVGCLSTDANPAYHGNNSEIFDIDIMCIDHCLKLSLSFAGYNALTGHCFCLSTFNDQHRLIDSNHKCAEVVENNHKLKVNSSTIYRTGYTEFGNHLGKRRLGQNNTQIAIVFFLTVGGRKNLRQIKRLLRAIYSKQHYYLIHVDNREDYLYEELLQVSKRISNIHLTNKRYPTTWGASTLLTAHLEAFKQIFDELKWNFSFVLNLSESDFPLKPIQVLTNFLSMYTSYNFLRSHGREPYKFIRSQGLFHTFIHCDDYMFRIGPRPLIQNIIYDGGSDWYVLNRDFVHYVTYGNDELVNGLRHIFNYSLLPCESFFHTVLSNSEHCDTYIRNNLRLVHWNRERGCKCQHKKMVDWCGCSPIIYRNNDKTLLNETIDKPYFFARKFDPTIDEAILDWLDTKISRRNLSNGAFYLQNIYHSNYEADSLNNVLKLIDTFARTILTDYQQHRRNCFLDDSIYLEQIHSIFESSLFQGYSLQYKFNDGEQFELLMKLNSLTTIRSEQVKRFEVGLELDVKEIVFLDRSKTFIEPKLVKVLIEWESMNDNDTCLVISSPSGIVLQRVNLLPSVEPLIIDIFFPVVSSTNMVGIWGMSIVKENYEASLASLNFLVLLSNEEPSLNDQYLRITKRFWSISNMCTTKVNSSLCHDLSNRTKITAINNCFEQRWSYFFYDIKSDW